MNLFNRIKKENEYWLVDQVKVDGVSEQEYVEAFSDLLVSWREKQIGYLSLLMDASYEKWLLEQGFRKFQRLWNIRGRWMKSCRLSMRFPWKLWLTEGWRFGLCRAV